MTPHDAFERILASLHQAMLDAAHWPAASALIDEACGAGGNAIVVGERAGGESRIHFARCLYRGESRQDLAREYLDVHYPQDAGMRRLMGLPEGRLLHVPDLYTEDELKTLPAYNEGWHRLGARNGLTVHFDEPDGLHFVWALGDPEGGVWPSAELQLVERLLPHVRQLVRMRQALAAAGAADAGLAGLLDNSRIGVLHLDRSGRLLAANDPALAILRRGDALFDTGSALHAWLESDHERLQKLVARALPSLWGDPPRGGSMTIRRAAGPVPLRLHISPLGDAQADFGARRVAALVLVVDPAAPPRIDAARVSEVLGLTGSQGRVAALLAEGNTVAEIVRLTGYRPGYVRTLLKRVYRKQQVSGQVSLVPRLLALDALPRH